MYEHSLNLKLPCMREYLILLERIDSFLSIFLQKMFNKNHVVEKNIELCYLKNLRLKFSEKNLPPKVLENNITIELSKSWLNRNNITQLNTISNEVLSAW